MQRRVEDQQLAYYKQAASVDYWDDVWAKNVTPGLYAQAREEELGYNETVILHYLPKEGWVIEVGPGLGQFVLALLQLGYDAEGIGWRIRCFFQRSKWIEKYFGHTTMFVCCKV